MKILGLIAAAAVIAAPAAAFADEPVVTTSIAVSKAGLDLSSERDAARLLVRLDRAALSACGASTFSVREVQAATRGSECYQQSMDQAVASLNSPTVNAVYRERAPMRMASN
ncbi:UrcA family protein [Phenylobacterium deserti]|nr:UrcA family protein [Phenylobacterium deserti]